MNACEFSSTVRTITGCDENPKQSPVTFKVIINLITAIVEQTPENSSFADFVDDITHNVKNGNINNLIES